MTMSQTFGVRSIFAQKLLANINSKPQKISEKIVKINQHQYHPDTIATYFSETVAKSNFGDALLVGKHFFSEVLAKKFRRILLKSQKIQAFRQNHHLWGVQ